MIHIFVNNFFCVACTIFALTVFKGNDLLYNLIVGKCLTILQLFQFYLKSLNSHVFVYNLAF